VIQIRVFGNPASQGSKRFLGLKGGKGIMIESCARVKSWREAVKSAALDELEKGTLSIERHCNGAIIGPVSMEITFTLPKPKSAPKGRRTWPDKKPDLSKLVRAVEDSLTDAGAWEDDARVVKCVARKVFPGEHPKALHIPGALIEIMEALPL
jgi:Holliday junction resolvase RusA-like endonuclease